jgi:GNAT superfamily N-acetyltransferase
LQWFLANDKRFLFHIEMNNKVVGYCGGFVPQKIGDGSASGMFQFAFNEAVKGIMKKPWLIFNEEVRRMYPFLWRNIKRKIFRNANATTVVNTHTVSTFAPHTGLVVIGVHTDYRGKGILNELMQYFDEKAKQYQCSFAKLSVKQNNTRAINAYKKFDWQIVEELGNTYVMQKNYSVNA